MSTKTLTKYITSDPETDLILTLRPSTLNMRENFRNILIRRSNSNETLLPEIGEMNDIECLDSNTIIELNN